MVKKVTILQVLEPFTTKPKESLHLLALSRELALPHPTVRQWLSALEERGIVKKMYKGRMTPYKLNFEHPNILDYLLIVEKEKVIKKCAQNVLLRELVSIIQRYTGPETKIIIFGSATENFETANDIDLLIVGPTPIKKLKEQLERIPKEFHIISLKSFDKITEALKIEIIKKHLILKGSEEVVRWMLW